MNDRLRELRGVLARFDAHRATRYVEGGGHLSGATRAEWDDALIDVANARRTLRRYEAPNVRPNEKVCGELARAIEDVKQALDRAERIGQGRELVTWADDLNAQAKALGAAEVEEAAAALSRRISSDPLSGDHEGELRRTQVDLALARARKRLVDCRSAATAADELVRRAENGVARFTPPPRHQPDELGALEAELDELRASAGRPDADPERLLHEAERIMQETDQVRDRIRVAVAPAGEAVSRRDDLRAWLRALTRRAKALGVSTEPAVEESIRQLDRQLWRAGCDLDDAEERLVRLTRLLDRKGPPHA